MDLTIGECVMRDELEVYTRLQAGLVTSMGGQIRGGASLESMPRSGQVQLDGAEWQFMRHGAGVCFKQAGSGVTVDILDAFERPALFDLWRLRIYFGSLGIRGQKILQRTTGARGRPMELVLEQAMMLLLAAGQIEKVGQHYRLVG